MTTTISMTDITGGVAGEKTYRLETEHGPLFITPSALEALAKRDLTEYMELIHQDDELWKAEWCCRPVAVRT